MPCRSWVFVVVVGALVLFGGGVGSVKAEGRVHAIVIGVSDYLHLDADLQGPANDAALIADVLMSRGVSAADIRLLSTGRVPGGVGQVAPLRAGIMAAMEEVAARATAGDSVFFYFSGHGAQAPDLDGDEGGGYDEIFLPADADRWRGSIGAVENAILDDELSDWARPMLARGVRLIGVIDACHSATGFRAAGGQGRARTLSAGALGIPGDPPDGPGRADPLEGEFVFLYSSQSDQRSFEYPVDGRPDAPWHGEFTLRLTQAMTAMPEGSWAQVLQTATESMAQGPSRQQPDGEGPLLSAQVFGAGRVEARFASADGQLRAGFLDGLAEGDRVALYQGPAGGEVLAMARIANVDARRARLDPPPAGDLWAEPEALAPPQPLGLGAPVVADDADYAAWLAVLPAGSARPDLVPVLTGGGLALTRADGVLDPEGPGSSLRVLPAPGESRAEALGRVLDQAGHALRLRALLLGGGAKARGFALGPPLDITAEIEPATPGCEPGGARQSWQGPQIRPCDRLWLRVRNGSGRDQDVTVIYAGNDFSLTPLWPRQGLSNRLAPGESFRTGLQIEAGTPPGLAEVWAIAVPAEADRPRTDLTGLAGRDRMRGATGPLVTWIDSQLDPETALRGFTPRPAPFATLRQPLRITAD